MATEASFLLPPSLPVAALLLGDGGVTIRAVAAAAGVRCPVSGEPSDRVLQSAFRRPIAVPPLTRPS